MYLHIDSNYSKLIGVNDDYHSNGANALASLISNVGLTNYGTVSELLRLHAGKCIE